jgi:two-component system sensor histidine kinase/response regulator
MAENMKTCDFLQQNLQDKIIDQQTERQLVVQMLEYRANKIDQQVLNELLKNLVLKYADAENKLSELNQLKNKFLGMAAHDLRNPLSSMRGFSEIMLSGLTGDLNNDQKEYLTIIFNTSNQMLSLVNDLLDVSVIESGKLDLNLQKVSIKKIIEDRLHLLAHLSQQKNITVHMFSQEIPEVNIDINKISQVIDNLITNAVKFSPPGVSVYISAEVKEGKVEISVKDEGPGISDDDREKLFGAFQKLSARPTGGEKSTGLGLSIVKKILDAHHGSINVKSLDGKGTTFTFALPTED